MAVELCVALIFVVLWPYIAFSRGHRSKLIWSCLCSMSPAQRDHISGLAECSDIKIVRRNRPHFALTFARMKVF